MVINISGHSYGIFNSASPVVWLPPTFLRIRFIIDNRNELKLRKFLVNFRNCSHLIFNYILNIQSIAWELFQLYLKKIWGCEWIQPFLCIEIKSRDSGTVLLKELTPLQIWSSRPKQNLVKWGWRQEPPGPPNYWKARKCCKFTENVLEITCKVSLIDDNLIAVRDAST